MSAVTESDVQRGGAVTVRPPQPTIGAEIGGVDLRYPLDTAQRDQVKAAIIRHWDSRAAVHCAVRNYGDVPRLLERILIADGPQYADL